MLARVHSCAVIGLDGVIVEVEVDTGQGLPNIIIVGLPDTAVQESRERVLMAIKNAGLALPRKRVTVNLAPASVRKEGPSYDLPIALGVIIATEQLMPEELESCMVVGEFRWMAACGMCAACFRWLPWRARRALSASMCRSPMRLKRL
jgi:magnesium chelatase family protein